MKQPLLGKTISQLRKQKGLTQEELVEMCNINVRTIQRIEAGEVTPRPYTIKTIFAALNSDWEELAKNTAASEIFISPEKKEQLQRNIALAIVFSMCYFLLGIPEFFADWHRWFDGGFYFSNTFYIAIKIGILVSYVLFIRAFVEIGRVFNNTSLLLSGITLLFLMTIVYLYEIISLYYDFFPIEIFLIVSTVCFGAVTLVFGVGLYKLHKQFGRLAMVVGFLEIFISFLFLTVILSWLGYIFIAPTIILEALLLYRIRKKIIQME